MQYNIMHASAVDRWLTWSVSPRLDAARALFHNSLLPECKCEVFSLLVSCESTAREAHGLRTTAGALTLFSGGQLPRDIRFSILLTTGPGTRHHPILLAGGMLANTPLKGPVVQCHDPPVVMYNVMARHCRAVSLCPVYSTRIECTAKYVIHTSIMTHCHAR